MKVCFVSSLFKMDDICGPSIFVRNISPFLKNKGIEVSFNPNETCDILFTLITAPIEIVLRAKGKGARVIQRLDGVFFDKTKDYKGMNLKLKATQDEADLVIYQSNFAKEMCQHYLGIPQRFRIIYNPVDTAVFTPYGKKMDFEGINLLAVSTWRPWKRLQDSVEAVKELLRIRNDIVFTIIGRGVNIEGASSHIKYLGELPHDSLPAYYRSSQVFLYPSYLDWCPNVVLEALSSGTPVICTDTGGTPELVGNGGIIIKTGEVFDYEPKDLYNLEAIPKVDPEEFVAAINLILESKREYSWRARRRARGFSLEVIGNQYLEVLREVLDGG